MRFYPTGIYPSYLYGSQVAQNIKGIACLLLSKERKGMQQGYAAFKAMFYLMRFHSYSMGVKGLGLEPYCLGTYLAL